MEMERKETEVTVTLKAKTVKWRCSWNWQYHGVQRTRMVENFVCENSQEVSVEQISAPQRV